MDASEGQADLSYTVSLTPSEIDLIRTALRMLEDTLGHEEAEELEEVQAILRRLPHTRPTG